MIPHTDTHRSPYTGRRPEPCARWNGPGFGHNRHHEHVSAILDGMRWDTARATLIACNDGPEHGHYLFRTAGGRYFEVRHNYPLRGDRTDPLTPLSVTAALQAYGTITARDWSTADPLAEAFPGVEVPEA